jgi:mycothiol synthase
VRNDRRDDAGRLLSLETEPSTEADVTEAAAAGLELVRCIQQLRIPLPLHDSTPSLPTRPFVPGRDDEAFLGVNNRAFEWHPDQSNWTSEHLNDRLR